MNHFTACFGQKKSSPTEQAADHTKYKEIFSNVQNGRVYTYQELQIATENFNVKNSISGGTFSSVYKGRLNDGTLAAIKALHRPPQLDAREFINEIETLSELEHVNLVKVYGCCIEGDKRMLVRSYLENNSLAQTLLGGHSSNLQFSWKVRLQICLGVAEGLAFLHQVQPHVVHGPIKASNVFLDKDFTPKISDFSLERLYSADVPFGGMHDLGYFPEEFVCTGRLTLGTDVYSFGVLVLEIISGRCNMETRLPAEEINLVLRARSLYDKHKLIELVDKALEGDFDSYEAYRYLKIGLICTQLTPNRRPAMSVIVKMLKGEIDATPQASSSGSG